MTKKNNERVSAKGWILQNLFVLAGVFMAIVNLFLASRLAPLNQDIGLMKVQVEAMSHRADNTVSREEMALINDRLDRIQASLDTLIKLHLEP